jgi:hypothetical protein
MAEGHFTAFCNRFANAGFAALAVLNRRAGAAKRNPPPAMPYRSNALVFAADAADLQQTADRQRIPLFCAVFADPTRLNL